MAYGAQPRLAVILHADVVGSTTMVRKDERLAHQRIQAAFRDVGSFVERYGGTVNEIRGDALVAEFARASDAVLAALAAQAANRESAEALDDGIVAVLRMGIALGEVVIADATVTGAGVVLAQRLEQFAEAGGTCVSGAVREALPDRLALSFEAMGAREVKGFDEPVSAYTVSLPSGAPVPPPQPAEKARPRAEKRRWLAGTVVTLALLVAALAAWLQPWKPTPAPTEQPSIAVLPFSNLSGLPQQEYLADGIAEDIIVDLSRVAGLSVISRQSSFSYRGTNEKVDTIGRELGVGHVLEGSVRREADRIRVTATLVDTLSGEQIWAQRYDRTLADVLSLQGDIARSIVDALAVRLRREEVDALSGTAAANFEAYDLFLQGRRQYSTFTREGFEQAISLYRKAIERDPKFGRAYGALAISLVRTVMRGDTDAPVDALQRAKELAEKAVAIDPSSPSAHQALGMVLLHARGYDEARKAIERSVELAPGDGDAHAWLALVNNYLGRSEEAARLIRTAMKLNPHYSWDYDYNLGRAYYGLGRYDKAAEALRRALDRNPNSLLSRVYLAASYAHMGRGEDAEWEILELETMDPSFTISDFARTHVIHDEELMARLLDDLRAAGVPE